MGHQVEVRLYRAVDGARQHTGVLNGFENGRVTIENGKERTFEPADIATVRLVYTGEPADLQ